MALLLPDVNSWLRSNYYYVVEAIFSSGGMGERMAAHLDRQGWRMSAAPADNYYELPRWIEIFLSTHYDPVPAGSDDSSELGSLLARQPTVFDVVADSLLRQLENGGDKPKALDVGANVGGMSYRLAGMAESVIAIDTAFNPILAARRIQLGAPLPRKTIRRYVDGLRFEEVALGAYPDNVEFIVASVFDLPIDGSFGVITALNVIDVVPDPEKFVDLLIERLDPGGLLVLTSPYSWGSDDVPVDNWLGNNELSSSEALKTLLTSKGLGIEEDLDFVPWVLREHQRWYRVFHNHCVIARKN